MSLPKMEKVIQFHEVGEITKSLYHGAFKVKLALTQRETFQADQNRRFILGANPETALNIYVESSFILGQLSVRVLEAPEWWNPNGSMVGGMDLIDPNISTALFKMVEEAAEQWQKEVAEMSSQADKVIKKTAAKKTEVISE